jgi:hypothetical protein
MKQALLSLEPNLRSIFALVILEMGPHKLFIRDWPQNMILLMSASQVVRITGVSYRYPAKK